MSALFNFLLIETPKVMHDLNFKGENNETQRG